MPVWNDLKTANVGYFPRVGGIPSWDLKNVSPNVWDVLIDAIKTLYDNINGNGKTISNLGALYVTSLGVGTAAPLNTVQFKVATNQNIGVRYFAGRASFGTFNDAGTATTVLGLDISQLDLQGSLHVALGSVPNYANDAAAAAGGLVSGDVYRTAGALNIKL